MTDTDEVEALAKRLKEDAEYLIGYTNFIGSNDVIFRKAKESMRQAAAMLRRIKQERDNWEARCLNLIIDENKKLDDACAIIAKLEGKT